MNRMMKILLLFSLLLSVLLFQVSAASPGQELFPVIVNQKYGYIDRTGKMVVEPQYEYADFFREGLGRVCLDKKYGFINVKGETVITPQYTMTHSFYEGLAVVEINGKYGYIDYKGKFIMEPIYEVATNFSEGLAAVILPGEDFYSYIDKTGKVVIKSKYPLACEFHNGRAAVEIPLPTGNRGNRYGYIDTTGSLLPNQPNSLLADTGWDWVQEAMIIRDFSEGFGIMIVEEEGLIRNVFIDKNGKILANLFFDEADSFSEGLAAVVLNQEAGYIDKTGRMVIKEVYSKGNSFSPRGGSFSEGLADVLKNGKIGFIDKSGKIVIEPKYDYVLKSFHNGLAWVKYKGQYIYIDKTGKIIWEPSKVGKSINDKKIVTDIANWNHPVKSVFQTSGFKVTKVELLQKSTYPIFYVTHDKAHNIYQESLLQTIAKQNGYWDFKIVDNQGYVEVYCDKKQKKIVKVVSDQGTKYVK